MGAVVLGAGACAPPTLHTYNDTSASYHGSWSVAGGDPSKYGSEDHYSSTTNATFSVRFFGKQIRLFSAEASWHGLGAVYIDGKRRATINEYSAVRKVNQVVYQSPTLSYGVHTITVAVSGKKDPRSSGTTIAFDKMQINGILWNPKPAPRKVSTPAPASINGAGGYVSRWGTALLLNGQRFRFTGFDSFVMMGCGYSYENLDAAGRDYYFAHLRPNSVTRIWLFPGTNLAQSDAIVASAKKYNQRVVFTLTDGVGGCGDTVKDQSWFASGYKGAYLNWIRTVVPHYANSPTVAFWELINEPENVDNGTLRAFFDTAGGLVHSLDHHHLVSSGTQPPWAYGGEAGYQYISASPGIDIMSMHEYDQVPAASGHLADALTAARADGKPLFVGEYGVVASPGGDTAYNTGNGGICETFSQRAAMVAAKLKSYFSHPEVAGALYWSYKNNAHSDCNLDTFAWDPLMTVIHNIPLN